MKRFSWSHLTESLQRLASRLRIFNILFIVGRYPHRICIQYRPYVIFVSGESIEQQKWSITSDKLVLTAIQSTRVDIALLQPLPERAKASPATFGRRVLVLTGLESPSSLETVILIDMDEASFAGQIFVFKKGPELCMPSKVIPKPHSPLIRPR
jgi:hypothetical protein